MSDKKRLDQWLVDSFAVPSKVKAQEIIERGEVLLEGKSVLKPGLKLTPEQADHLTYNGSPVLKYVSRSGLKLEGAFNHLGLSLEGQRILDVGCSTGGFSHCSLEFGADEVVGVDVGKEQIAKPLLDYKNFTGLEEFHANALSATDHPKLLKPFDLVVIDVSFTSIEKILDAILTRLRSKGHVLALVKPQFELDSKALNKKGLVKDPCDYVRVEAKIKKLFRVLKLNVIDYFPSTTEGRDGNQEFFIYAQKS